jgi:hypothetical protein
MAGRIDTGTQKVPSGPTPLIPAGNASNIRPPQRRNAPAFATGPQHLPSAPYPFPRIPVKLPWGAGSTGIGV